MNLFLSFDDGRIDFYTNVFPVIKKYKQVATLHITTGFIDGSFKTDDFGINRQAVTIEQLIEMKRSGIGISSHGDKHILDIDDFLVSNKKMIDWGLLTENEKIGFSVPNSRYTKTQIDNFVQNNHKNLKYIRVGRNPKSYRLLSKISFFFYHYIAKNQISYNLFNRHNVFSNSNLFLIYSVVIKKDCRLEHIERFLLKYAKRQVNVVLMFHSVVEKPSETWEWNIDDFTKLIKFCLDNDINIKRLEDL